MSKWTNRIVDLAIGTTLTGTELKDYKSEVFRMVVATQNAMEESCKKHFGENFPDNLSSFLTVVNKLARAADDIHEIKKYNFLTKNEGVEDIQDWLLEKLGVSKEDLKDMQGNKKISDAINDYAEACFVEEKKGSKNSAKLELAKALSDGCKTLFERVYENRSLNDKSIDIV